jgi:hypothetical protein
MEKSNKRGKIPQSDWPLIMGRYEAGETLASIARTYDCSPPAISYVVSKSRARQPAPERSTVGPSGPETQLVKSTAGDSAHLGSAERPRLDAPPTQGSPPQAGPPQGSLPHSHTERRAESMSTGLDPAAAPSIPQLGNGHSHRVPRDIDGSPRHDIAERGPPPSRAPAPVRTHAQAPEGAGNGQPAAVGSGTRAAAGSPSRNGADNRHRLHLSLGNGASSYDGSGDTLFPSSARSVADENRSGQGHAGAHSARPPSAAEFSEAGPGPDPMLRQNASEAGSGAIIRNKEGTAAFIDQELRARVDTDIAAFLAAFDAALMQDTQENRSALREATDRLLRAGARTRIELERLEARLPLSAHDRGGSDPGAWRYR